ncbi:hypothetical protein HSBAA_40450 [Vreelandella sulfidaeris]|uniref:SUF system Fe-S cluster assembly regulator n=1 Tax=Vreelandella sulfidaeris TaxID=115553 RepID=A0A455UEP3_9GAMM|nr:hypothetical protein HSBAA_40450 [Halomonas sulfidaeris]
MLKLSRLTDYAAVVMAQIARHAHASHAAADLAEAVQLPHPTVSKTLKMLARAGLLVSQRGAQGGYRLARPASQITAADIIAAIEGPCHDRMQPSRRGLRACRYLRCGG